MGLVLTLTCLSLPNPVSRETRQTLPAAKVPMVAEETPHPHFECLKCSFGSFCFNKQELRQKEQEETRARLTT